VQHGGKVNRSIRTGADIDSLFAFAKAADIKVIYTVRMESNSAARRGRHRKIRHGQL